MLKSIHVAFESRTQFSSCLKYIYHHLYHMYMCMFFLNNVFYFFCYRFSRVFLVVFLVAVVERINVRTIGYNDKYVHIVIS